MPAQLITLFLISILVRSLFLIPLIKSNSQIKYDEKSYYKRAVAFHSIFKDLLSFNSPETRDMNEAYKRGIWPPFHSIFMAIGFLFFGKKVKLL